MNFVFRSIQRDDLDNVMDLARQFSLLNLPADRRLIEEKIETSKASFAGELSKNDALYVFVIEDVESKWIAGSSQIIAKHGTPGEPTYSFQVLKKERFSKDLGVGFIHQILRLKLNENGPTEIGGLVVDRSYRSRPERIGKTVSLGRFMYIGMFPERFEDHVYAQMAPPLTEEGRSEFWESLGRRFTGMPYQEADILSQQNQEFIRSLFPEEDIYQCLLDAKARLVLGRVGPETQPALHMLEDVGFTYMHEVDPFDGGPHVHCKTKDINLIKTGGRYTVGSARNLPFVRQGLIGLTRDHDFIGGSSLYAVEGEQIFLPEKTMKTLELSQGEEVYLSPIQDRKKRSR